MASDLRWPWLTPWDRTGPPFLLSTWKPVFVALRTAATGHFLLVGNQEKDTQASSSRFRCIFFWRCNFALYFCLRLVCAHDKSSPVAAAEARLFECVPPFTLFCLFSFISLPRMCVRLASNSVVAPWWKARKQVLRRCWYIYVIFFYVFLNILCYFSVYGLLGRCERHSKFLRSYPVMNKCTASCRNKKPFVRQGTSSQTLHNLVRSPAVWTSKRSRSGNWHYWPHNCRAAHKHEIST